jgi:uncharacterized membrane protein
MESGSTPGQGLVTVPEGNAPRSRIVASRRRLAAVALKARRRMGFGTTLLVLVQGAILAGIVHLIAILTLPSLGEHSAWQRLEAATALNQTVTFARPDAPGSGESATPDDFGRDLDPAATQALCRFDLTQGPVRVTLPVGTLPQSLSVHGERGGVNYAVSDRAATRGQLVVVLFTQRQLDDLEAQEEGDDPSTDLRVVVPGARGLVLVRAIALFPSQQAQAEAAIAALRCQNAPMPAP